MKDFKVEILGTKYDVLFKSIKEDESLKDKYGYCDYTLKKIVICNLEKDECINEVGDKNVLIKDTVRHEIIHAFLNESGLQSCSDWSENEEMIDWIAIQMPKMFITMKDYI